MAEKMKNEAKIFLAQISFLLVDFSYKITFYDYETASYFQLLKDQKVLMENKIKHFLGKTF